MAQIGLLRWSKSSTTTTSAATSTSTTTSTTSSSSTKNGSGGGGGIPLAASCCSRGCLTRLVRRIRRQGRSLTTRAQSSGSGSTTRRRQYDPLSYSLNFDRSECGKMMDDEDYYHFCAFSSRFVSHPHPTPASASCATTTTPSPMLLVSASH